MRQTSKGSSEQNAKHSVRRDLFSAGAAARSSSSSQRRQEATLQNTEETKGPESALPATSKPGNKHYLSKSKKKTGMFIFNFSCSNPYIKQQLFSHESILYCAFFRDVRGIKETSQFRGPYR